MFLGYQNGKIVSYTETPLNKELYSLDDIIETQNDYAYDDDFGQYVIKDESWAEKQAQKEAERIGKLHLTRGDVFRGLLMAKGVTRSQIRGLIDAMPEETQEQKLAKEYALIDFDEALEFYRGVSLIDAVGLQLGITPEQMTKFFETNDYKELLPKDFEDVE